MTEPPDPMVSVGRVVGVMLAILIGVTLALYEPSNPPAAPPTPSPSASSGAGAGDADFNAVLDYLADRARDGIRRHGDFKLIVVGMGRDGSLLIAEDATNALDAASPSAAASAEPLAPNLRAMKERIERGDMKAYGWAQTVHAPGEKRPDGVFIEIVYGDGQMKRREMAFSYNVGGRLEFYAPEPASRRPGAAFVEPPTASPAAPASSSPASSSPAASSSPISSSPASVAPPSSTPAGNSSPTGGSSRP